MKRALVEVSWFKIEGRIIKYVRFVDDTAIITKTKEELQDMANKLFDTGRKYDRIVDIDKYHKWWEIPEKRNIEN